MIFKPWTRAFIALAVIFAVIDPVLARTVKVIGFGDSLMAGYQLGPGDGFTAQLQRELTDRGVDAEVANAGVSGDTTSGGLARLDWSVPDDADLVILELGANDALRGISPDVTRKNLDAMIARLKERNIDVLLAGMLAPPNMGPDYETAFNGIYTELAEKHGVRLYPFFLDGVTTEPGMLLSDGMHPNPDGVGRMVEGILPVVTETINAISAKQ